MNRIAIIGFVVIGALTGCATLPDADTVKPTENQMMTDKQNREAILAFYNKALTVNTETRPTAVLSPVMADGYASTSSTGSKGAEALMGQLEFFWKIIPDLKWDPQEIVNEGDTYVVRSLATGTPNGDFMGTPTDGSRTFKIMTIDIHTMKDGMFVSTHHVEDWATAMGQLRDPEASAKAAQSAETMKTANAFMEAMGKGDMDTMVGLMDDNMEWRNEGDKTLPWIGPWKGKTTILEEFLPLFGENLKTTEWTTNDAMSSSDTAAYFGRMKALATNTNQETEPFTFALRVKVKDGKIVLWNWLEDSFGVSNAYHGK